MERLQHNILRFLKTGQGNFEPCALELFAYQFEKNRSYQAYCRMQERTPEKVHSWQNIPAVPVGAFKSTELCTFPVGQAAAIFESSGTTREVLSRHFLKTLTYYETSLKTSFEKWVLNPSPLVGEGVDGGGHPEVAPPTSLLPHKGGGRFQLPFLILAPAPAYAPRSSLAWMLEVVKRAFGAPGSRSLVQNARLDELHLATLLAKAEALKEPVALLGTTIAFLRFFEYAAKAGKTYRLCAGSRVMDTGGMKSEKRESSRPEFVRQVGEIFGIPENVCLNEYGMCELSSQFYGRGASSYLEGPPWTRTLVMDPVTGRPASAGTPGLLRHFDLANVDSVLAIQTEDLGIADGNGFILQGRDPCAEVKGCSLSAEAFLS